MVLHRTDVDGVPVVWAAGDVRRVQAGLVFRVGRADETLAGGGVTHLVEHLALYRAERPDLHVNGMTSPQTTTFLYAHDDPDELSTFFAAVCGSLRDLPADRLAVEKQVLRAEAGTRGNGAVERLLTWRYGPFGYGLPAFAEFGLDALTIEDLRAWVAARFTRGNAVLWISGAEPPAHLRLDLPEGPRMAYPAATSALPRLPAYFNADAGGLAFDAVVPRSAAAKAYASVLSRRMHARLRRELGVSYHATAAYQPRDERFGTVLAIADMLPENRVATCREFVDLLLDLARNPIEVGVEPPETPTDVLAAAAEEILAGGSEDAGADVTPQDVAKTVLKTGLALLPNGTGIGRAGFVPAPATSQSTVDGTEYRPRNRPDARARLIVGADGLSLVDGLDTLTVHYATCPMMLAWPDGGRLLFADDSVTLQLEPQLWAMPSSVRFDIDAAIPAERIVGQPPRDDRSIPTPPAEPVARTPVTASLPKRTWLRRHQLALTVVATALSIISILAMAGPSGAVLGVVASSVVIRVAALSLRRKK